MTDWIVLRKTLASVVLPPTGPLLLTLLGLALVGRSRRLGTILAWIGMGLLLAISTPVVSGWLADLVGGAEALDLSRPVDAQVVVILSGGVRHDAAEYQSDTLNVLTLERVRYGAYIARRTTLPVLVTGGVVSEGEPEAQLMKAVLEDELRVPVRWTEPNSRNTSQNARFSATALKPYGISKVVLVTHTFDARRARMEFEAAGLTVVSAPVGSRSMITSLRAMDFLPSISALNESYYACYELLALAARQTVGL